MSQINQTRPTPYAAGKTLTVVKKVDTGNATRVVNLSVNESCHGPAPGVVEATITAAAHVHLYPDTRCTELRKTISVKYKLDPEKIICGNGSEEILDIVGRVFARAGDEILFPRYSFLQFGIVAYRVGATAVETPVGPNFEVDIDGILAGVTARTKIVYLANPNNPTGTVVPQEDVVRLVNALPPHIVLVLDCAYAEFAPEQDFGAAFALADEHPNILVTRTLSKAYGMAASRVGWGYGSPELIAALNNMRGIGNVNGPAQFAAIAALAASDYVDMVVEHATDARDFIDTRLRALGFRTVPCGTNFCFAQMPQGSSKTAQAVVAHLARQGYVIRSNEDYGLGDWLRISVGKRADLEQVLSLIEDYLH